MDVILSPYTCTVPLYCKVAAGFWQLMFMPTACYISPRSEMGADLKLPFYHNVTVDYVVTRHGVLFFHH
jgi:hypothetical protein